MASKALAAGGLLLACLACAPALAQDARAGRAKAQMCSNCHGVDGIAVAPDAPNLAGESAAYIASQLTAFKEGRRSHEQMSIVAAGLSAQDIADLARWFSLIEVKATVPDLD